METARTESLWEDPQNIMNSWPNAAGQMCPTGVGSGDILFVTAHTAGDTSQSTLRHFCVAIDVSLCQV